MPQSLSKPPSPTELSLPALRQELQLHAGAPTLNGVRTWLIHDPVRHRYFQVTDDAIELLRNWRPIGLTAFCQHVAAKTGIEPSATDVRHVIQFIYANNLSLSPPGGSALAYAAQIKGARHSPLMRAIHGYLFFRIPLFRPQRFLAATMPLAAPFYSRTFIALIAALTLIGLYLALRQWEVFSATFLSLLTWDGALLYAAALVLVKTLHELGHAYTATRYGVRVNTMGVAFMIMMPLLYTDVSDAWRLTSRRQKLAIDAAGLAVELSLAGIATFLWAFLPDGHLRSIAFVVATTSWMLSVFVNLNPFMRFDGYYLLSDAWGIPNLQSRAFAMARWQLREFLFGLKAQPPEVLLRSTRAWLVAYAVLTWVYRLFLFIGIALIVYHMFFKLVGVALFTIEILWFIALPIWREVAEWWKLRKEIMSTTRTIITLAVATVLVAIMLVPWRSTVIVPAVTWATSDASLYPKSPGRLVQLNIKDGDHVSAGQTIAILQSDALDHNRRLVELRIALLRARLNRIAGDTTERANRMTLITELEAAKQERIGLIAEHHQLTIRAPISGAVRDLMLNLRAGRHLTTTDPIARIILGPGIKARGYVNEEDLARIAVGTRGHFIPDDPLAPRSAVTITHVTPSGTPSLELKPLASIYGGPIASDAEPRGGPIPRAGQHLLQFDVQLPFGNRSSRGVIHLDGHPQSIAAAVWRRILRVLVREASI